MIFVDLPVFVDELVADSTVVVSDVERLCKDVDHFAAVMLIAAIVHVHADASAAIISSILCLNPALVCDRAEADGELLLEFGEHEDDLVIMGTFDKGTAGVAGVEAAELRDENTACMCVCVTASLPPSIYLLRCITPWHVAHESTNAGVRASQPARVARLACFQAASAAVGRDKHPFFCNEHVATPR
jgi:hypothetical protein